MRFTYLMQPIKRWTFEAPKTRQWVEGQCIGRVLNLFAGKQRLDVDELRVDLSGEWEPDIVLDGREFVHTTKERFNTVILDPPYTYRKAKEKYHGKWTGPLPVIRDGLQRILSPAHTIITLGYETSGMGKKRGDYEKTALCCVCHGGEMRDTLILVEDMF